MGERLGQHFLSNQMIVEQIAQEILMLAEKLKVKNCREIGPGQGVLTRHLINGFEELVLFEIDKKMKRWLEPMEHIGKVKIVRGDVLKMGETASSSESGLEGSVLEGSLDSTGRQPTTSKVSKIDGKLASDRPDLTGKPSQTVVVGNLPYYITSPIFRKFFVDRWEIGSGEVEEGFIGGVFLIQKEVAEKIATGAKKKSYLRRLLNCHYQVDYCFTVPANCFAPPPKVDSAVVKLEKIPDRLDRAQFKKLLALLDIINPYKRKTLGKILKIERETLDSLGVSIPDMLGMKRMEELDREEVKDILK